MSIEDRDPLVAVWGPVFVGPFATRSNRKTATISAVIARGLRPYGNPAIDRPRAYFAYNAAISPRPLCRGPTNN